MKTWNKFIAAFFALVLFWATPMSPALSATKTDHDQWADDSPAKWQTGNLNPQNSDYVEGDSVPHRLVVSDLALGVHTVRITYDFTKAGTYKYDTLTTYNQTENPTGIPTGTASTFPFPHDPHFDLDSGPGNAAYNPETGLTRNLTLYGGTITSITPNATHSGSSTGDSSASVLVTFTSTSSDVTLLWAGHLAKGMGGWGAGFGAAAGSGAPFHMEASLDGGSAPDRSIQLAPLVPVLDITKTADSASVTAGSTIGYTITVTNSGGRAATGVSINDALPGGPTGSGVDWSIVATTTASNCAITGSVGSETLNCTGSTVAAGGGSIQVHVTSPTSNASCGTYDNAGATTADDSRPQAVTDTQTGTASISVTGCSSTAPVLTLTKTADSASVTQPGTIGYKIRVTNTGNASASNVSITDALPGGTGVDWSVNSTNTTASNCSVTGTVPNESLSCTGNTLAAGASITVHVTSATTNDSCKQYDNDNATASDGTGPANDAVQSGTASITVTGCVAPAPVLELTKTADNSSVAQPGTIGYMIRVTNTGNAPATGVSITDALPGGTGVDWSVDSTGTTASNCSVTGTVPNESLSCTGNTLAAGASIRVHVTSATTNDSCKQYDNAGASATDGTRTANQTGTASITVTGCVAPAPVLELTKTADASPVNAGSPIGYMIRVTNTGNAQATNVSVSDLSLPGGAGISWSVDPSQTTANGCSVSGTTSQSLSCTGSTIAQGASITVHITSATTNASCGTYTNTGASATDGTRSANQQGSAVITVQTCVAGVVFTNTQGPKEVAVLGEKIGRALAVTGRSADMIVLFALLLIAVGYLMATARPSRVRS